MSKDNNVNENTKTNLRLSDDAVGVIRELVQLSLLTGTNVVDHFRALRLEVVEGNYLVPTEDYIEAYNDMVVQLEKDAEALAKEGELPEFEEDADDHEEQTEE